MQFDLIHLLMHWVVSALALALTAALVPGFRIRGFSTALGASVLIGFANYAIWPILFVLTLPFTIVTLGLFVFVIDAIVLRVCASLMTRFEISNWFSAIIGAMILAALSSLLHWMVI